MDPSETLEAKVSLIHCHLYLLPMYLTIVIISLCYSTVQHNNAAGRGTLTEVAKVTEMAGTTDAEAGEMAANSVDVSALSDSSFLAGNFILRYC